MALMFVTCTYFYVVVYALGRPGCLLKLVNVVFLFSTPVRIKATWQAINI